MLYTCLEKQPRISGITLKQLNKTNHITGQ